MRPAELGKVEAAYQTLAEAHNRQGAPQTRHHFPRGRGQDRELHFTTRHEHNLHFPKCGPLRFMLSTAGNACSRAPSPRSSWCGRDAPGPKTPAAQSRPRHSFPIAAIDGSPRTCTLPWHFGSILPLQPIPTFSHTHCCHLEGVITRKAKSDECCRRARLTSTPPRPIKEVLPSPPPFRIRRLLVTLINLSSSLPCARRLGESPAWGLRGHHADAC